MPSVLYVKRPRCSSARARASPPWSLPLRPHREPHTETLLVNVRTSARFTYLHAYPVCTPTFTAGSRQTEDARGHARRHHGRAAPVCDAKHGRGNARDTHLPAHAAHQRHPKLAYRHRVVVFQLLAPQDHRQPGSTSKGVRAGPRRRTSTPHPPCTRRRGRQAAARSLWGPIYHAHWQRMPRAGARARAGTGPWSHRHMRRAGFSRRVFSSTTFRSQW